MFYNRRRNGEKKGGKTGKMGKKNEMSIRGKMGKMGKMGKRDETGKRSEDREMIRIFRQYARLGLARARLTTPEKYRLLDRLWTARQTRRDMLAAHDTIRLLELGGQLDTLEALREIYLRSPEKPLDRSEIGARVAKFARENFCDERTVYRRLERARKLLLAVRERLENEFPN